MSKYGVISGSCFPAFGLDMEIYSINLRIQFKCKKTRARNNSVFGHFSRILRQTYLLLFSRKVTSMLVWNTIILEHKGKAKDNEYALNVPDKYWYHVSGTVQLILGHCLFLSLYGNLSCVTDIFSFVQFLWIFSMLWVLTHLLEALLQEVPLFSTAR